MVYIILLLIIIAIGVLLISPMGQKILVWIGGLSLVGGSLVLAFFVLAAVITALISIFNGGTGNPLGTGILAVVSIFLFFKIFVGSKKKQGSRDVQSLSNKKQEKNLTASNQSISKQFSDIKDLYHATQMLAKKMSVDEEKDLNERINFLRDAILKKEPDLIESPTLEDLRSELLATEKEFARLIENADDTMKTDLSRDMLNYFLALHDLKMAWCILEADVTNESVIDYGNRVTEPEAIKEEIRKKLKI